jgi:hypothetical protein
LDGVGMGVVVENPSRLQPAAVDGRRKLTGRLLSTTATYFAEDSI